MPGRKGKFMKKHLLLRSVIAMFLALGAVLGSVGVVLLNKNKKKKEKEITQ